MCPCRHALANHSDRGCGGDTFRPGCSCRRNVSEALEAAITVEATAPWHLEQSAPAVQD